MCIYCDLFSSIALDGTAKEAKRILISSGIFAAYDYDWPPTVGAWETESAYVECMKMVREYERALPYTPMLRHWNKDEHLGRMQASGCFRYTKEIVVHHTDKGNAERLVGLLLSQGSVMTLLKNGINEKKFGIDHFREKAQQTLGIEERTWHWSSRVRLG